jgi:hypothetical protein
MFRWLTGCSSSAQHRPSEVGGSSTPTPTHAPPPLTVPHRVPPTAHTATGRSYGERHATPLIVFILIGEMVNVLNQRLGAYARRDDQQIVVISAIVANAYEENFVHNLMTPQPTNVDALSLFDRIVNVAAMRINAVSLKKLCDLSYVVCKRQILQCAASNQLMQLTLMHMERVCEAVNMETKDLVRCAIDLVTRQYGVCSSGQWLQLQQEVLKYFQDCKTRAKPLMHNGAQEESGRIVLRNTGPMPLGAELPGEVRYFSGGRLLSTERLPPEMFRRRYRCAVSDTSLDPAWNAGCSIYTAAGLGAERRDRSWDQLPASLRAAEEALKLAALQAGYRPGAAPASRGCSAKETLRALSPAQYAAPPIPLTSVPSMFEGITRRF